MFGPESDDELPMADMNATPLIDVLLVLLIMVIVTIPVVPRLIDLAMPAETARPASPSQATDLRIDDAGVIRWNGEVLADAAALEDRLDQVARASDPPEIHLRAGGEARYGVVAGVMAALQRHHITKFAMVGTAQFLDQGVE